MGMTMTQKILAAHAGLPSVSAGQLIEADLDLVLGNDITSPVAIHEIGKMNVEGVFHKDKIALVMDHFAPNKDIKSAEHCKCVREFACKNDITNYFDVGEMGIEHALLPEKGLTVAGDVIIGADSHTCTYGALGAFSTGVGSTDMAAGMATGKAWFKVPSAIKFNIVGKPNKWISGKDVILHIIGMIGVDGALYKSMEFVGEGIKYLSMDDRFTIANMAIEAGGKNGIFPVDDLTRAYMKEHSKRPFVEYEADADAEYDEEYTIDLSTLKSTVSFPHLPDNTRTIDEVGDVKIDQVVIGSCTNGRMEDLRTAAEILKGKKVAKGLRVIVIPATQQIYLDAMEEGLLKTFIEAGAVVSTPTCGPCLGGYMGILAEGEKCVSTTNRNFVGRMGHVKSEVYLASPAVAAASAVTGKITKKDIKTNADGMVSLVANQKIESEKAKDSYVIKEETAPEGFIKYDGNINLSVSFKKEGTNYILDKDNVKVEGTGTNGTVKSRVPSNTTIEIYIPNDEEEKPKFDLALRKFISKVDGVAPTVSREPVIDAQSKTLLDSTGTAAYHHTKDSLKVKVGSQIEYTLRVYNEGEVDGYAKEITDYLPQDLKFVKIADESAKEYTTTSTSEDNKIVLKYNGNTVIKAKSIDRILMKKIIYIKK